MSQSTRAMWNGKMTHPTSNATPSSFASASPSSSSKPRRSPFLLENGNAFGLAQTSNLPRSLIESSGRASANDTVAAASIVTATMRIKEPKRHARSVMDCPPV